MMLIVPVLVLFVQLVVECRLTVDSPNNLETNLVAEPDNIHSLYRSLFHMGVGTNKKKETVVDEKHIEIVNRISIPESEGIRLLISVTSMLWDTAWKGFFHGFLPKVERVRRETRDASSSSSWLVSELTDWLLDALGALMGKGGCRDMVACRTGRLLQDKLPGSQVLAMLGESLVPKPARHFFNVVRRRLMEQSGRGEDSCSSTYTCSLAGLGEEEEFEMSSMNPR